MDVNRIMYVVTREDVERLLPQGLLPLNDGEFSSLSGLVQHKLNDALLRALESGCQEIKHDRSRADSLEGGE